MKISLLKFKLYLFIISLFLFSHKNIAQDGKIDSSFAIAGHTLTEVLEDKYSASTDVIVMDNGQILATGTYDNFGKPGLVTVKYNMDGTLDTTFGENGLAYSFFADTQVKGVNTGFALQNDGKIVIAGYSTSVTDFDIAVSRLTSDGKIDSSFGENGAVLTEAGEIHEYAYDMAVQNDDKIVLAGSKSDNSGTNAVVVRYMPNGELDASFGENGIVETDFDEGADDYRAIALQNDGKIITAGYTNNFGTNFILARYNSDGSLDTSFDEDGKLKIENAVGIVTSLRLLDGNQILALGSDGGSTVELAKINSDGTLDNSFGEEGTISSTLVNGGFDGPNKLLVQENNKFIVIGSSFKNNGQLMSGQRFNSDGTVDFSFAEGGSFFYDLNGQNFSKGNSAAMASDGSIYISGVTMTDKRIGIFTVLKLNNNSAPLTDIKERGVMLNKFKLHSNYPNPFNPSTNITFELPSRSYVELSVYNLLGEHIEKIVDGELAQGLHKRKWVAENLPSGVYFFKINAKAVDNKTYSKINKMILMK